ncbi:MAG: sulfatase [Spirochaetaceae bacterium]|nr:MAG: sulfatase [Spirochaetaceae bacterium]
MSTQQRSNRSTGRPNFILLVGEDTGRQHGCYGDPAGTTPTIDALADSGLRYTNACATGTVCAPSRAALVTGRYQWSFGAHHMRSTVCDPPRLFTHELRDAGYHVRWPGKTDFNFEPPTDFADGTADWIDDLGAGRLPETGFFVFHNLGVTHESTMWPDESPHSGMVQERLAREHELSPDERHDPTRVPVPPYLPDTEAVRTSLARYYDALTLQDHDVARVLEALRASPYAENTIVMYMSDHGRGVVREKRWCYEAGIHLPLIVHGPGITAGVDEQTVSWVDVAPTVLTLAGVPVPDGYHGLPFLTADREPAERRREIAFAGRDRMDEGFDRVRAARSRQFLYIRNDYPDIPYAQRLTYMERHPATHEVRRLAAEGQLNTAQMLWMQPQKPAEELYDVEADPANVHNLVDDAVYSGQRDALRAALEAELSRTDDLGLKSERKLIAEGVVTDRLTEYSERLEPLPEEFALGDLRHTVLEMPERS